DVSFDRSHLSPGVRAQAPVGRTGVPVSESAAWFQDPLVGPGQPRRAAQLFGAAASVAAGAGADDRGPHAALLAEARESATRALGEAKFGAEFDGGKRLSRQAAMRLALDQPEDGKGVASHGAETGPLAKREVEVAQLVAEGLSNKQVAARLVISERTVATHVGHILDKLGFNS